MANLTRLVYSHQAMAEAMIANPSITARELSVMFGRTESWIGSVRASGMFREILAKRHAEIVDPMLVETVAERFESLATRSLEILMEKISRPANEVSDELALQAAALGAKGLGVGGFGAKVPPPAPARAPDWLERSAERLRALNQNEVIDVQARPLPVPGAQGPAGEPAV